MSAKFQKFFRQNSCFSLDYNIPIVASDRPQKGLAKPTFSSVRLLRVAAVGICWQISNLPFKPEVYCSDSRRVSFTVVAGFAYLLALWFVISCHKRVIREQLSLSSNPELMPLDASAARPIRCDLMPDDRGNAHRLQPLHKQEFYQLSY